MNGRPDEGGRSENRAEGSASTVAPRGRFVAVVRFPFPLPIVRALVAGAVGLAAPGLLRDLLVSLLAQLTDPAGIERGLTQQRARALRDAWSIVLNEEKRARGSRGWYHHRFEREWAKYPDPATGDPYPLPRDWQRSLDYGLPWYVVRDQIHDTLTGNGQRTFRAVVAGCARTRRRLRDRAERLADAHELAPQDD